MTKDEALKLALEYLEAHKPKISEGSLPVLLHDEIITTIKTQLGVINEPLASISYIPCCTDQTCPKCKATTPPQRTWVGLTDEEMRDCLNGLPTQTIDVYARRIEAKLKQKNI
jgi:hypothetical protein